MARAAIRGEGDKAESHFLTLVKGSRKSDSAKKGDVIVTVDGNDHFVEIKECHAAAGKSGTINQVRAIKFIACVIWVPNYGGWYVLSPVKLVEFAASKKRGQHNEVSFECMNLSLSSLKGLTVWSDADLTKKVAEAIRRGEKSRSLRELMEGLLADLKSLMTKTVDEVRKLGN